MIQAICNCALVPKNYMYHRVDSVDSISRGGPDPPIHVYAICGSPG